MGRRVHPIALRLKKVFQWRTTQYTTGHNLSSIGTVTPESKEIATSVLDHIFQFALISKPTFKYTPNQITVGIYAYQTAFHAKSYPLKLLNMPTVEGILAEVFAQSSQKGGLNRITLNPKLLFNCAPTKTALPTSSPSITNSSPSIPVKLEVTPLKHPYLEANIMAQYVAKRLNSHSLIRMYEDLKRKIYDPLQSGKEDSQGKGKKSFGAKRA
jgi:hypothetical protein